MRGWRSRLVFVAMVHNRLILVIQNFHMLINLNTAYCAPWLYDAGNDTGGWESDTYCDVLYGTGFGFALNSERIAGENAVKYITQNYGL
jgi:hypothetical protein